MSESKSIFCKTINVSFSHGLDDSKIVNSFVIVAQPECSYYFLFILKRVHFELVSILFNYFVKRVNFIPKSLAFPTKSCIFVKALSDSKNTKMLIFTLTMIHDNLFIQTNYHMVIISHFLTF